MSKVSAEELFEKYENAFAAQSDLEERMDQILETAENREEAEKQAMRGIMHDINAARAEVNKAWKEYSDAVNTELGIEDGKGISSW